MTAQIRIRCRPIGPADLDGVATLLARGFPARPERYWAAGLSRMAARSIPEDYPRFGFLIEHDGVIVGALLVIAQEVTHDGPAYVRCNLASWYVEPAFRSHAAMLSIVPFRHKAATFVNISAAPNTWATIEAQGFVRYTFGQRVVLPLLGKGQKGATMAAFEAKRDRALPEAQLLADHAASGCLSLVGRLDTEMVPFVFLPARARQGRLFVPGVQLVYCRDTADLGRFARPLGRLLAMRGTPLVLLDDTAEGTTGLPGFYRRNRARKYVRGLHQPRLGDLASTEFTVFGS